jgi:pimeloyl-ACP methyl ester carboxylesterase
MDRRLLYLGGNGHCTARLAPARTALARLTDETPLASFDLVEAPYPGFEGRPRAHDLEQFLNALSASIEAAGGRAKTAILYGTGIGGLFALCLRARGEWMETPLLLQAPVLWGLEHRLMPRVMRFAPARRVLGFLFASAWFQRHFAARQFERPLAPEARDAFFAGYASCAALPDLFAWVTPRLLRRLEVQFAAHPEALRRIECWWGGRDRVVSLQELAWTEKALGTRWPVRTFPHWGHYPMIDEPEEWVRALSDVLATPESIQGPNGPQTE